MPLDMIQAQLQDLYDLHMPYQVTDFLVTDSKLARHLSQATGNTEETLFIRESDDTLDLSLFVDDAVLRRLAARNESAHWNTADLNDFWQALEGVSHFLCVVWRAERNRSTTALELELQAEVDKFILTARTLGEHHGTPSLEPLKHLLFQRTRLRDGLSPQLQYRYRRANHLAESYCHQLHRRHSVWPPDEALLSEIRRFYRFDSQAKEYHIRRLG